MPARMRAGNKENVNEKQSGGMRAKKHVKLIPCVLKRSWRGESVCGRMRTASVHLKSRRESVCLQVKEKECVDQ